MVEIIDETVAYYSEDVSRRSVRYGQCLYKGPYGKRCAYARMCTDDSRFIEDRRAGWQELAILKPEYYGYEDHFYEDLQGLHDSSAYWDESGLTPEGISQVQFLKHKYS